MRYAVAFVAGAGWAATVHATVADPWIATWTTLLGCVLIGVICGDD